MSEQRRRGVLSRIPAWMRPIPEWFCRYPFLLIMTGLVLAIIWGLAGVDYGVPFLFWADRPLEQYVAALGVTCLLGKFCFNGYLLACDACWMRKPNGEIRTLRWYLAVTWLPLLVFGLLLRVLIPAMGEDSFTKSFNDANYAASLIKHIPFVMGVLAGVLLSIVFVLFAKSLQIQLMPVRWLNTNRLKDKLPTDLRDHVEQEGKGIVPEELQDQVPVDVTLHALSITFFLLFGVLFLALVFYRPAYNYLPPALIICVMLGLIADLYGAICFHSPRAVHLVTTLLVLITILCSAAPDKHRFVGLEAYYAHPESLDNEHYDQRRQEDCGLIKDGALPSWLAYYYAHRAVSSPAANNPPASPSPVEHPAVEYRAAAFRAADRKAAGRIGDTKNIKNGSASNDPALPKRRAGVLLQRAAHHGSLGWDARRRAFCQQAGRLAEVRRGERFVPRRPLEPRRDGPTPPVARELEDCREPGAEQSARRGPILGAARHAAQLLPAAVLQGPRLGVGRSVASEPGRGARSAGAGPARRRRRRLAPFARFRADAGGGWSPAAGEQSRPRRDDANVRGLAITARAVLAFRH
ncbi:MAG: hypothetical protein K8T25_01035 [Planctomycetia bacterium]|nr:hypothetical protein [Planctomycetia bacterium]